MGITKKQLGSFKESLAQGDITTLLSFLDTPVTGQDLHILREQKLLFKVRELERQIKLATAYKIAATQAFSSQSEVEKAQRYADFSTCFLEVLEKITQEAKEGCQLLQPFSLLELAEVLDIVLDEAQDEVVRTHMASIKEKEESGSLSKPELAELSEYVIHTMHGRVNDLAFAGARVLNLIGQSANRSVRPRRKELYSSRRRDLLSALKITLLRLVNLAIYWNTLEYAIDMVSYGEWYISDLKLADRPEITFAISDIRLYRARQIGIRREIIRREFYKKKPRWLSQSLQDFAIASLNVAIEYYESNTRTGSFSKQDYVKEQSHLLHWLESLDAEDEFLWALAGKDLSILTRYLSAIALRCFSVAAEFVRRYIPNEKGITLICPQIPIDKIVYLILESIPLDLDPETKRAFARKGVDAHVSDLPAARHFDIINKPYIRITTNHIVGLRSLPNHNWTPSLRASLVKGGDIARLYGNVWEEFIADNLKLFGWNILGRGIRVRAKGRTLTDIDILGFKQGVLLIIQVKVISGGGYNTYDHWKARNTIVKGVEQATIAEEALSNDPKLINSLLSSSRITESVQHIQPMVITTSPLFNGWIHNNVPVAGGVYVNALFRGVHFAYKEMDATSILPIEHEDAEPTIPTIEQFLRELNKPQSWDIAKEGDEIEYMIDELPHLKAAFPDLKRDILD